MDLERFSEDIDLALLTKEYTKTKIKTLLKSVEQVMSEGLIEEPFDEQQKSGDYRYSQFGYPSIFHDVQQLLEMHPMIRLEISSFMEPEPFAERQICSMITNYLLAKDQTSFIEEYELGSFPLQVLSVERTLLEKLVSLIRMSYEPDIKELLRKTRHLYDIHCIYTAEMAKILDNPAEFLKLKSRVTNGEDKSRFGDKYPYTEPWHNAPLFKEVLENESVVDAYVNNFGAEFVFGELPPFTKIKETFRAIAEKLRMIE